MDLCRIGQFRIKNETETKVFAEEVAAFADVGDVICLFGGLGAGKTNFSRSFIRSLTKPSQDVPSPTYTLVQNYEIQKHPNLIEVWHFDLYRISEEVEIIELGIEDACSDGIVLIEWPENALRLLPERRLEIHFEFSQHHEERILTLCGSKQWRNLNIKNIGIF
jgi:tRNA threonylcarbamoyl adenosine modification protein YjeE